MKRIKNPVIWFILVGLVTLTSAASFLLSGVYRLENSGIEKKSTGWTRVILKGETRSLGLLEIKAVTILPGKGLLYYNVEAGVDELFLIMEGSADLYIGNKPKLLTKGSVAVIPQGERIRLRNGGKKEMIYFNIRLNSGAKSANKITPFFSIWDTVTFVPSSTGGHRNIINRETSALKALAIDVATLKEGAASIAVQAHHDEEIILLRKGIIEVTIGEFIYSAEPGSAVFITNDDPHRIRNAGKGECEYYSVRWVNAGDKTAN